MLLIYELFGYTSKSFGNKILKKALKKYFFALNGCSSMNFKLCRVLNFRFFCKINAILKKIMLQNTAFTVFLT